MEYEKSTREGLIKYPYHLIASVANVHRTNASPLTRSSKKKKGRFCVERRAVSPFRVTPSRLRYQYNLRNTSSTWDMFLSLHTSFVISLQPLQIDSRFEWAIDPVTLSSFFFPFFLPFFLSLPVSPPSLRRSFASPIGELSNITLCREFVNERRDIFFFFLQLELAGN